MFEYDCFSLASIQLFGFRYRSKTSNEILVEGKMQHDSQFWIMSSRPFG